MVHRIEQVITTSTVLLLYVIFQVFFCYDSVLWTKILEHCVLIHFEDKNHNAINVAPVAFLLKILVCYGAICLIRIWAKVHMYCSQSFDWDVFFCLFGGLEEQLLHLSKKQTKNAALHVLH